MNRFKFRLQSVLKYKEAVEERKMREFSVSISHLHREEEHYETIKDSIRKFDKEREEECEGSIDIKKLVHGYYFSRLLERKRNEQKRSVELAERASEIKRNELTEAMRRRKILEKLREKKVEEYNSDTIKEEQAQIDDSTTMRFNDSIRNK